MSVLRGIYRSKAAICCLLCLIAGLLALALKTAVDLQPLPDSLLFGDLEVKKPQLLDRSGNPLLVSYQNKWSVQCIALHEIPALLRNAFIESEDRRFYAHGGPDWPARLHALSQNLLAMRGVRAPALLPNRLCACFTPGLERCGPGGSKE